MLKRAAAAALVAAIALSAAGCGGSDNDMLNYKIKDDDTQLGEVSFNFDQLPVGGGGYVTEIIPTCEEGVMYVRTDVGGAYRWSESEQRWRSLSLTWPESGGLLMVDGLAVDPTDAAKIYVFCGSNATLLISEDYGETFETVDVSDYFKIHGNGLGRGNSSRIMVDPNNTDVLIAGGRSRGIAKSEDGGKTWRTLTGLDIITTENEVGINCVMFDRTTGTEGEGSSRVFAGVSRTDDANLYVSNDAGETWEPLNLIPSGMLPTHLRWTGDDKLVIVYSDHPGPGGSTKGGFIIYDPNTGDMKDFKLPDNLPVGDVAVDPENPQRIAVSTNNVWVQQQSGWGDRFFVSTDGGTTWNECSTQNIDTNGCTWLENGFAIHWTTCLVMDPFNPDTVHVVSGNGVFTSDNIFDYENTQFYFDSHGIEETVPLSFMSVPGGKTVTGVGDIDGCMYEDIHVYSPRHPIAYGNTTGFAYCATNPNFWLKLGDSMAITEDGGATMYEVETRPASSAADGSAAIAADGSRIFWSTAGSTYYTDDKGKTWQQIITLAGSSTLFADPVDSNVLYAVNSNQLWISKDKGLTFEKSEIELSVTGNAVCVVPGRTGTLLIQTSDRMLNVSTDFGMTCTPYENLKIIKSFTVGKAANDERPPVIYIWGRPVDGEVTGLYASEDGGATWVKLNEDDYTMGGVRAIYGDNNRYGTVYFSTNGLGFVYCEIAE